MKVGRCLTLRPQENLATRQLTDIIRLAERELHHAGAEEQLMRVADNPLEIGRLIRERETGQGGDSEGFIPNTVLGSATRNAIISARANPKPFAPTASPAGAYHPVRESPRTSSVAEIYTPTRADIGDAIDCSPQLLGLSGSRAANGSPRSSKATSLALAMVLLVSIGTLLWFVLG